MGLDLAAIPLAFAAGVLGVLSPCVWPLVPVVTSSAATNGRTGPLWLAAGLSLAFAAAGTGLTFVVVSLGLDPEIFRIVAAGMLVLVAGVILVPPLGVAVETVLSRVSGRLGGGMPAGEVSARGQFGVGALLGIVWLPCVGPTLGAAIALAAVGQSLATAFVVMLAYGIGTAAVLLAAGVASARLLARWRPALLKSGGAGKKILGGTLLLLGLLVLSGADKTLETFALQILPSWVTGA